MVNKFGESSKRGPPGPVGPIGPIGKKGAKGEKGDEATEISFWFPKLSMHWWRKEETCSFYFDDGDKDGVIFDDKKGKITHLKNKSADRFNARALRIVRNREREGKNGYSLTFDKSLYFIEDCTLGSYSPSFACIFLSFKVFEYPKTLQYLITSPKLGRAICIENNKVKVFYNGKNPVELEYLPNFWTVVFVQWSMGKDNCTGFFSLDTPGAHTTFKTEHCDKDLNGVYIGGTADKDDKSFFSGKIMCIDFYDSTVSGTIAEPVMLPQSMQNVIKQNHQIRFIN